MCSTQYAIYCRRIDSIMCCVFLLHRRRRSRCCLLLLSFTFRAHASMLWCDKMVNFIVLYIFRAGRFV